MSTLRKYCRLIWLGVALPIVQQWMVSPVYSQQESVIKAAYIRNALNFARWPNQTFESTNTPFRLGLAGNEKELEQSLQLAFGQLNHRIQNRKVELKFFRTQDELTNELKKNGSRTCHALFIPASEGEKVEAWIDTVNKLPIFMISCDVEFIEKGGTVSLVPKKDTPNRYMYHIHIGRLRTQNLRFNAEFLRIQSAVKIISK